MRELSSTDIKVADELYYCLSDDHTSAVVLGCMNNAKRIIVPAEMNGVPVTRIENGHTPTTTFKWYAKEVIVSSNIVIGHQAFAYSAIEKVTLKSGVVLQSEAFFYCKQLTRIHMEPGVVFEKRPALWKLERYIKTVHMHSNTTNMSDIPLCTQLLSPPGSYDSDAPTVWSESFKQKMTIEVLLKGGVTFQAMYNDSVFGYCEALTEIVIPNGVEFLPNYTFWQCESLCKIVLPRSLKAIGAGCFCACRHLANIVLPEQLVLIGADAFACCDRLQTVVLPASITHIVKNPFRKCKSLARIVVPSSMDGLDGHVDIDESLYPYAAFWNPHDPDNDNFNADKSWKQIFQSKASKVTTEMPVCAELDKESALALKFVQEQSAFDKQKDIAMQITDSFLENIQIQPHTEKYSKKDMKAMRRQMNLYIEALRSIAKKDMGNQKAILAQVKSLIDYINGFDRKFSAVETEERESICMLINNCAQLAGFQNSGNDGDFDITQEWRNW